jgi:hypothetical protein
VRPTAGGEEAAVAAALEWVARVPAVGSTRTAAPTAERDAQSADRSTRIEFTMLASGSIFTFRLFYLS